MPVSRPDGSAPAGRTSTRVGSSLWIGDVKRLLRTNIAAAAETVWLCTITAPGQAKLPCSTVTCGEKGSHVQRSAHGCRVDELAAVQWNRAAPANWSELHHAACERLRRAGYRSTLIAYVWQLQTRGVLHVHFVLGMDTAEERAASVLYVATLKELAASYEFGYVDGRDRDGKAGRSGVMEAALASAYLSRYMTDSSQFTAALARPDRPRRPVYVTRRATSVTACTMRNLRRVRYLWRIRNGTATIFAHAGRLPSWFRNPLELAPVHALAAARAP
jgi:hypothetical protein